MIRRRELLGLPRGNDKTPVKEASTSSPFPAIDITKRGFLISSLLALVGCGGTTPLAPNVMPSPVGGKNEDGFCRSRNVEICKPSPFWDEAKGFFDNIDSALRAFSGNVSGILIENHRRTILQLLETDTFIRAQRKRNLDFNARYNAFRNEFQENLFPHLTVWDRAVFFAQGEFSERPYPLKVFLERLNVLDRKSPEKLPIEAHRIIWLYTMQACLGRYPNISDIDGDTKQKIPALMDYSTRLLLEEITRRLLNLFPEAYPSSRIDTILKALTPFGSDSLRTIAEYKASVQQNFDYFDASIKRIIGANPQIDNRYASVRNNPHATKSLQENNRQFLVGLEALVVELKTLLEDVGFLERLQHANEQDIKESKDPHIQKIFTVINNILFTIEHAKDVELTPSQKRLLDYSVKTLFMETMTWNDRLRRSLISLFTGGMMLVPK